MEINKNIKEVRLKRKLSQRKLADEIGVTAQFISLVENGGSSPSIETLKKIATALEVSINELLGTSPERVEFEEDFDITVFDEDVIQYISRLKKALKKNNKGENITNTTILQNLIINRMADDMALKTIGLYGPKIWLEFTTDRNGNLLTGKELQDMLKENYISEHLNKKKDEMIIRIQSLIAGTQYSDDELKEIKNTNSDELKNIKKFYYDAYSTYEHEIPKHIKYLLEFDE